MMARRSNSAEIILVTLIILGLYVVWQCVIKIGEFFSLAGGAIISFVIIGLAIVGTLVLIYQICLSLYTKSQKFDDLKKVWLDTITDCNAMNRHIEELKHSYSTVGSPTDEGEADFIDNSRYNYLRPALQVFHYKDGIYNLSRQTVGNVKNKPFYYVCKYAGIKADEETLADLESILENLVDAEQGQEAIQCRYSKLINDMEMPSIFKFFSRKKIMEELGIRPLVLDEIYFRQITFRYTSAGGNSSLSHGVKLDTENLNRFICYIAEKVKFRRSIAGQRALMTNELRQRIKERDNYTCQRCGNSIYKEANLLLEIDHIKPLAKGGITSENNLQVLCWRCNRHKGAN